MGERHHAKVIIIGSGPAGYTAAIYSARAALQPMLISGLDVGGQMSITTDVENYPGFADVIQGPWLMEQMRAQAEHVGTRIVNDIIVDVDLSRRPFRCTGDSGDTYVAGTLIVATGAQARWLGIPSEAKFKGFGVSACATCDGFFFKDKELVVVGGGDTAMEEATFLTKFATKVSVVHRRDQLRASKIMQDRAEKNPKITFVWNTVVEEVYGDPKAGGVTGVKFKNVKTGMTEDFKTDGLFIAIGHEPNSKLFVGQLELDATGYILTHDGTKTNVPGVFACGDVQDHVYRQAITAAGTGCMAAIDAERYLENLAH
jgi:thioredoxin reductase (NADPH)